MAKRKRKKRNAPNISADSWQPAESRDVEQNDVPQGPLQIRLYGDEVLRKKAFPIQAVTEVERKLAEDMLVAMYAAPNGIGLAAPQVGVLKRLIVIDVNRTDPASRPLMLINPEIESLEGESIAEEGCLSIPDVTADIKRAEKAVVTALNTDGEAIRVEGEGFLARALQHEIDHLDGVLFIDHVSGLKRQLLRGKLRKLVKEQQAGSFHG